jgi:tRNA A-37 threonylcarbamoyl transferase component Bud32
MNRLMHVQRRFAPPGVLPDEPVPPPRFAAARACAKLLLPRRHSRSPAAHAGPLPDDVVRRSASRLRLLALLYASAFFIAGFVPSFFFVDSQAHIAASPLHWAPGAVAVVAALAVAGLIQSGRMPMPAIAIAGLLFEVIGSYGIVAAELANPIRVNTPGFTGFSWVAVWTLLFAIVVPTRPRHAAVAALASVSSVPIGMVVLTVAGVPTAASTVGPVEFFFTHVFAYVLVVVMAYVSARAVYGLGTEVSRARELGSYRLVEPLGHGGMGEVWRAEHRLLARPSAVKLIRPSFIDSHSADDTTAAIRRFEREAQVTSQLRSPHTVHLFDFGAADDGSFYYAMEFLEGIDVETLVRRFGPVPAERAIFILRQICHSLSEAHSCGLVHRDIKPANIFLCRYGEDDDFVKVLDFGIVKSVTGVAVTTLHVTLDRLVQGTPGYLAPEQALGRSIDARADIYGVGCVAYWLLTGATVFTADTPIALIMQHIQTAPAPPSRRSEMPIPAALDALVLSCLAKNPADRPQSAKELSRRLADLRTDTPWTEERARAWWLDHGV